jgi:sulfur carrier protein
MNPGSQHTPSIEVNGARVEVRTADLTVRDVLTQMGYGNQGVAVAINGLFVPRSTWEHRRVEPGDRLDVVGAAQGG